MADNISALSRQYEWRRFGMVRPWPAAPNSTATLRRTFAVALVADLLNVDVAAERPRPNKP